MALLSFADWAILRSCFLQSIEPASSTDCCYWSKPWGYKTSTQKDTFKQSKIFILYINLRASLGWQKFSALCLDRILIALLFMLFKKFFGAQGLSGAVSLKNFFSTPVKVQFAEQLKLVFSKTSFQRKDHCLKGKRVVSDVFFKVWLGLGSTH